MNLRLLRSAISLLVLAGGPAACSRPEHKAAAPEAAPPAPIPPPVAGGPSTLKPGLWKTVTRTPAGDEASTQCVGAGYDPGAEAAAKASPCGRPTLTRTASGFRLDHACEKDGVSYALTGVVSGDFTTTATTDLDLTLSAFGRRQTLHLRAVSTYQGPCQPGAEAAPAS